MKGEVYSRSLERGALKWSADGAEGADWMLGEGNVDRFFCLIG